MEDVRIQHECAGAGPLYQRDYWAVLEDAGMGPRELVCYVAREFERLAPPGLARFHRRPPGHGPGASDGTAGRRGGRVDGGSGPAELDVGDELEVDIRGAGRFAVRVVHRDANSFTAATLTGHPEAGRITFGAYRSRRGDVVFHIRSRARSSSRVRRLGFLVAGDPMQTNTWCAFLNRLAASLGTRAVGAIHAEKRRVAEEPGDRRVDRPTFIAEGD